MMNFEYWNPTRVVFGSQQLNHLPELLKENKAQNILVAYGGGSIKQFGLFDEIMKVLKSFKVVEFGGIEPNPQYTTLMKAVELGRKEKVDFILAVGGGSVIDGVKFISGAIPYKGEPWDVLSRVEGAVFESAVPFGTVLTIPATGSEVNSGAVVSRKELNEKRTMGGPQFFPKFSFCDPKVVSTLPKRQLANGIIDAFVHTLEQYLTTEYGNLLQEREAEAILATLIDVKDVVDRPDDYRLAYNFMLSASHALNGNLRCGAVTDWATHMIGHELTALYNIDHARTLAIIAPRLYEVQFELKLNKLVQYGQRIFGLKGEKEEIALRAIQKTEEFFQSLGVNTKLSEYNVDTAILLDHVRDKFQERGWTELGMNGTIQWPQVEQILKNCI